MTSHDVLPTIPLANLTSVRGGEGGFNFNQSPAGAVQEFERRFDVCTALGQHANKLQSELGGPMISGKTRTAQSVAKQCWDQLNGK